MSFHGFLARLFPSVPPRGQAVVLAAMEGRELQFPVSSSLGEDGGEAGHSPAADGTRPLAAAGTPVVTQPVSGGGTRPEGEAATPAASAASSFSGPPACETQVAFCPHPANRWDLTDERIGALTDRWGATS